MIHFLTIFSEEYQLQELRLRKVITSLFPEATYHTYNLNEVYRDHRFNASNKFGFFVFKPELIIQYLKQLNENDIVIYIDTNDIPKCGLVNYVKRKLSNEQIDMLVSSTNYFQYKMRHKNSSDYYSSSYRLISGLHLQPEAGCIAIKKNNRSMGKTKLWLAHTRIVSSLNFEFNDKFSRHDQEALTYVLLETSGNHMDNWFWYRLLKRESLRKFIGFEENRGA